MNEDLAAIMQGLNRGNTEYQGMMPSGSNVGGAAAPRDPAAPMFDEAFRCLSRLSNYLLNNKDSEDANKVGEMAYKIQGLGLERQKKIAKQQEQQSSTPNINAMGVP